VAKTTPSTVSYTVVNLKLMLVQCWYT